MNTESNIQSEIVSETKSGTMEAAVITAPGKTALRKLNLPNPTKGEVRLKLEGSGICASNLPVWEGRDWFDYPIPPGNPGHEGWGIIDEVGEGVAEGLIGKRVTGLTYNAFAEYDLAKIENLVEIPESLSDQAIPGEPLGCAMNIFERAKVKSSDTVAVVGAGFLGLLLIQLLKDKGCKVIAISRRNFSLEMAKKMGADHCIPMDDHYKIIEKVKELTSGEFCDKTIECTGVEWPLNLSIEITGTRGKLVVAGFHQDGMRSVNMQLLNWRGIDLISAHERDSEVYIAGIKKAIAAIQDGRINPTELFTHTFSLADLDKGLDHLKNRPDGFIKGLIVV